MRMQILKIVVVLLVAGSGDARPQKSNDVNSATQTETSDAKWRDVQARNKTHDTIRDSRYTGTSGRRKLYITRFRDNVNSSREHNAVGSRASDFAPITRSSFSARRSKIDDIWTVSEFKTPLDFSRMNGEITDLGAIKNSNKPDESLFGNRSNSSRFVSVPSKSSDLGIDQTINYSGKINSKNLERPKSDATLNQNVKLTVAQTKYSTGRNNILGNYASGLTRMSNDNSVAKNRQKSNLVKSESLSNKHIIENNTLRWNTRQVSIIPSSHIAKTKISIDSQESPISTHSIRKDHKWIHKNTDSIVTLHENVKPDFVTDSFRYIDAQRDDLNNLRKLNRTRSNLKSKVSYDVTRRHAITSSRNFVRLRNPYSAINRDASNVALNLKLKDNDNVKLKESMKNHLTRTTAKRPTLNNRVMLNPTKNHHFSHAQNLSSQVERVDGEDTTRDSYDGTSSVQYNVYLKNWPNKTFQNIEDLYNYEKYTSSLEENSNRDSDFHDANQTPMILSSNDGYYNHPDPIIDASVKKIVNWLKVATIVPNNTQFIDDSNVHKPDESIFESIYENLEPNRPLSNNDRYETVVLQDAPQNQNFDEINYYEKYPNLAIHPSYTTNSANLSPTLTSFSDAILLRNKTVYNPTTYVTQNTVVHILNNGLKESNLTQSQSNMISANQTTSFSTQSSNADIKFEKDKEPSKQETNTFPLSYNCPTIMINTYTRVNNTIQSKEGCTDLNIIVNSHVLNMNVFKPSSKPTRLDQQTLATESYDDTNDSDKYGEIDDLFHQDSLNSYVTVPIETYDPLEASRPAQNDYYNSQQNPNSILDENDFASPELSTVEVFQNTQISVLGSGVSNSETDLIADNPVESFVGDNVAVPPAAVDISASESPVVGNPGSNLEPISANMPFIEQPLSLSNPATSQANNGPGSLQFPVLSNLPSRPGLSSTGSLGSSQSSSESSYNDDDDDDFDMSPGGVLQSVASVFTYFSLFNPLGYSFFSLAAAPFAAMAAGVLGIAAVVFPWAIPNVFDFGRAADKVTIRFKPNLEEFVKQAVHKYNNLNEWKSRRKKRRK